VIRVAVVGFGFMGRMHWRCWKALDDVEVAAVCDCRRDVADGAKAESGNIEGAANHIAFRTVEVYHDFEKMLDAERLDAVSLALPTYLHAEYSTKALQAGVNVFCEKPMALNPSDCDRMIEAANSSGKVLQVGHCLRFWPEYSRAKEIVDGGEYGSVVAATFQRLGSAPGWAWDDWLADERRGGGMVLDLHIHDTDFVQYLFGVPHAVQSFGARTAGGQLVHIVTEYFYDDGKVVTAEGSWEMMASFGFEMSFNIMLEKATLVYDCTRQPTLRVCPAQGEAFAADLPEGDGYLLEIAHFAKRIRGEKTEEVITLEQSRESVRIVVAEKESVAKGRPISLT
jgi:predicted dehydrogenase